MRQIRCFQATNTRCKSSPQHSKSVKVNLRIAVCVSVMLLAIYSYFAEAKREFISMRTKQGLAAARASCKKLGRPKGSRDKERVLDLYREQIKEYLYLGLSLSSIINILNPQLEKPISYPTYRYFVRQNVKIPILYFQIFDRIYPNEEILNKQSISYHKELLPWIEKDQSLGRFIDFLYMYSADPGFYITATL